MGSLRSLWSIADGVTLPASKKKAEATCGDIVIYIVIHFVQHRVCHEIPGAYRRVV